MSEYCAWLSKYCFLVTYACGEENMWKMNEINTTKQSQNQIMR